MDAQRAARRATFLAIALCLTTLVARAPIGHAKDAAPVVVFAAASVSTALQDVSEAFARQGGGAVKYAFAASSTLAKQIENGAEADIFVSADEDWMQYLVKNNRISITSQRLLLTNELVLIVPKSDARDITMTPDGRWLQALPAGRIATGDPAHVPVGKYARTALQELGQWAAVESRLARADNARNALVLVERGEAVAGIVYRTDAQASPKVHVAAVFPRQARATPHLHAIVYPAALVRDRDSGAAKAFFEFLFSDTARTIFARHGFAAP